MATARIPILTGQTAWDLFFDKDWNGIVSLIETYSHYEHVDYLNILIYMFMSFSNAPHDILQKLFDKRQQIRRKEIKNGRDFPPYETEFALQLIYDICCFGIYHNEDRERCLYNIDIYGGFDRLRLPTLDLILQDHEGTFLEANEYEKFEKSKRDLISLLIWRIHFDFDNRNLGERDEDLLHSIESVDDLRERNELDKTLDLWQRTERIIMYRKTDPSPLLHYVVKNGYPFLIIWFISRLYPDQISQRDDQGYIPLHYSFRDYFLGLCADALHDTFYTRRGIDSGAFYKHPGYEELIVDSEYAVPYYLIERYPEGASVADSKGKLPLQIFLEKVRDGRIFKKDVNKERCQSLMDRLIRAEPQALVTRDMSSHLLPFMIPSMWPSDRNEGEEGDDGEKDSNENVLTLTFDMLRQNPSVLNLFIDPNRSLESYRVRSLRQKLSLADEINMKQQNENNQLREEIERLKSASAVVKPNDDDGCTEIADGNISQSISHEKKRAKLA